MTVKLRTRDIEKTLYANFFKRALECLNASRTSFSRQEWNASTINAIHSCIAACDAMCVYFLGKRSAGENHGDAFGAQINSPPYAQIKGTFHSQKIPANVIVSRVPCLFNCKSYPAYPA